jgi:hypothetical protein
MIDNRIEVDYDKLMKDPRYYSTIINKIELYRGLYGDITVEMINTKVTNWRERIQNG